MTQLFFLKCDKRDSPVFCKFLKPHFVFFDGNACQLLYCLAVYIRVRQTDTSFFFNYICFFIPAAAHSQCHHPGNDLHRGCKRLTGLMNGYCNSNLRFILRVFRRRFQAFRQLSCPWKFTVKSDRFSRKQGCRNLLCRFHILNSTAILFCKDIHCKAMMKICRCRYDWNCTQKLRNFQSQFIRTAKMS